MPEASSVYHLMFLQAFKQVLNEMPFIVIRSAALIGMVSVVVMLRGRMRFDSLHLKSIAFYFVVSAVAFFILMAIDFGLYGEAKPQLRNDLLFLAGFFCGWRCASVVFAFIAAGCYLFGFNEHFGFALLDMGMVAYGAVLIRPLFRFNRLEYVTYGEVALLLLAKWVLIMVPLGILAALGDFSQAYLSTLAVRRTVTTFTVSVPVFYMLILLLRQELLFGRRLYIDSVSDLPNRNALLERLEKTLGRSCSKGEKAASSVMLLINVANSRELIQEHDHDRVDAFYYRLGQQAVRFFGRPDLMVFKPVVYYFSVRSLAVVMDGLGSAQVRERAIAQALYDSLTHAGLVRSGMLKAWITVGVVDIGCMDMETPQWFLRSIAVMESLWNEPVHYFDSRAIQQFEMEHCLRDQMERWIYEAEVPLWFQPKVDLNRMKCIGAEALLRVPRDNESFYSPFNVISVAERYHRLGDLEWAIVCTVVKRLKEIAEVEPYNQMAISVNVSSVSLQRLGFGSRLCRLLQREEISSKRLVVEVVETSPIIVSEALKKNFEVMAQFGIQIALDDFGTGYSSLELFSQLKFDELKIDNRMTGRLGTSGGHIAITLAVEGAQRYGATVVAEGIETEAQCRELVSMGVQQGQGYLFAKAMPFERFLSFSDQLNDRAASLDQMKLSGFGR